MIKKLWANVYFRNVVYAFSAIILLIILSNIMLNILTRHGEARAVPNFIGKSLDSIQIIAKNSKLRYEIVDSVFRFDLPKGTAIDQNPAAGFAVKKNRKIFITMNSLAPRKENVPDVVGYSLRQAQAQLTAKGFRIGRLSYTRDIATNNVLAQKYQGAEIQPGVLLTVGAAIDLDLGLDSSSYYVSVPSVSGLTLDNARNLLVENSLNNKMVFNKDIKTITDSLNAVVYKQEPAATSSLGYGDVVTVYLKLNNNKK